MNGIPDEGMPAMKGKLSEAEMREIVRYVRTAIQKVPPKPAPSPST
jgi:mono/diheme cytochrome c family protein